MYYPEKTDYWINRIENGLSGYDYNELSDKTVGSVETLAMGCNANTDECEKCIFFIGGDDANVSAGESISLADVCVADDETLTYVKNRGDIQLYLNRFTLYKLNRLEL